MGALPSVLALTDRAGLALSGALLGMAFGYVSARANFCVMGAISDARTFGSPTRLRAVALAMATALLLTQTFAALGYVDLTRSMYLAPRINWVGAVVGGLLFGTGMVYAGGCASRNLIRAGGGDVRALLVLLCLSIAAFATISGVLGPLRSAIEDATAFDLAALTPAADAFSPALPDLISAAGVPPRWAPLIATLLVGLPLLLFAFTRRDAPHDRLTLAGGAAVGILVAGGWLVTGLAYDEMALRPLPPQSLSFVRPVGDAIDWLERSTALGLPGFGAASIFGVLTGSMLASLLARRWKLTGLSNGPDVLRHLAGAVAMGIGGVMALGCSIGQGISGFATLSVQSMLATSAIFAGAVLALRRLERDL